MTKKWKIFGIQTNVEWYDVKTKFKQLLRRILYSWIIQELICLIILTYMKLVYYSSKKSFVNYEVAMEATKNKIPLIFSFWHNRLMMIPFTTRKLQKTYPYYKAMTLASRHGDGRFVGKILEKMGFISIYGSSQEGRKASRGIEMKSLKQIINGLKNGYTLGITPDGPRGPSQEINGGLVNIARLSGAKILIVSYSSSRNKRLRTWDKFYIPLPFSKLCFYFDKDLIEVPKNLDQEEIKKIEEEIENKMNIAQVKSKEYLGLEKSI